VAALFFLIYSTMQLKKMAVKMDEFLKTTDQRLKPVLEETEKTLKSIRRVSDDIATVSGSVREVSGAVLDVATNVQAISMLIGDLKDQISLRALGIKAGVQTALGVLLKHQK
jgi:uncharacterized protein YoxC